MRQVEFFRWWVSAPGRKRPYLTSFPMTAKDVQERYPGARAEPATREVRELPETAEELARSMVYYQSAGRDSVQPPLNNLPTELNRPTQPGSYRYRDPIGGTPQHLEVREVEGELVAVFRGIEGDTEHAEVPVADMAGWFEALT